MAAIAVKLNTEQKVQVTLNPVDSLGKPQPLASVPVWVVVSGDATVDGSADPTGLSVFIVSGTASASVITVTAEGDPTPGVDTLTQEFDVTVVNPEDVTLGAVVGTPVNK